MFSGTRFDLRIASRVLPVSALLGLTLASAVFAAPPGDIVLGDITVFRLTTAVGNVTAEQRASLVQDRINQAISIPNVTEKDVRMVVEPFGPTIYVRKIKIVTVDPATAESQGVTPVALAKTWAHRLMGVIAQVCIRVPVAPPNGGGAQVATTPGQPAPGGPAGAAGPTTAATGTPAVAATTSAAPNAAPATAPATPAVAPTTPAAPAAPATAPTTPTTPATPATPAQSQPAAPAAPTTPTTPADPPKAAPVTPTPAPTRPTPPAAPAPTNPAAPPATPPAVPATPPATSPTVPIGG